jgi:hypothetical protein
MLTKIVLISYLESVEQTFDDTALEGPNIE